MSSAACGIAVATARSTRGDRIAFPSGSKLPFAEPDFGQPELRFTLSE